ncbi:MAG: DUF2085 domain-containing protein [Pyrinomonadaceae bacterium]
MPAPAESYVPQVAAQPAARAPLGRAVAAWLATAACVAAFVAAFFAAPVLAARGDAAAAFVIYRSFAPLCHQIAERSFYVAGHPLAVCARCAGVYVGFTASLLFYPLARDVRRTDAPPRAWLFAAAAPTALDFLINFVTPWHNTHWSRALSGALLGAAAVFYVVPGLVDLARTSRLGARSRRAKVLAGRDADAARAAGASVAVRPQSFTS